MIDGLYRRGATSSASPPQPCTFPGTPAADELKFVLSLVNPRWFVPVHGEYRHLSHHARLAREVGIPADRMLIAQDGDTSRSAGSAGSASASRRG